MESWSQLHHRLRASDHRRSCAGAMKRSSVRASLTTGATCAAASASIWISSSVKARASMVCTTSTPCSTPRSISGTPQKRLVGLLARFAEIFEARMTGGLLDGHRPHLFGHQARQPFVQRHAQRADAFGAQPHGRGQHQVGAVRLQQIGGADVGLKARRRSTRPRSSASRPACRPRPPGGRSLPESGRSWQHERWPLES